MKRKKFLVVLFVVIATAAAVFGLCACNGCGGNGYTITVNTSMPTMEVGNETPFVLNVGDEVDYTEYFIVKDKNGMQITVTEDMLDLSLADTSTVCSFTVTLTVGGKSLKATFMVMPAGTVTPPTADISEVLSKYADSSKWNFAVNYLETGGGYDDYEEYYEYLGDNILNTYKGSDGGTYTEYLGYDASSDTYYYYMDNADGTYTKYDENSDEFSEFYSYARTIDLSRIASFAFSSSGDCYKATNPSDLGNEIIGEYQASTWTEIKLYIANEKITKIIAVLDGTYNMQYEFVKYGEISFKLPDATEGGETGGGDGPTIPDEPTGTMENQTYNEATFDKETLQDKMLKTDGAIGLPSTGDVNALVIPVQFKGDTITSEQLANLNLAFNGTSEDTGWESVKTYYQKASYGKLNLTFDIQGVYQANNNSSYYASYSKDITMTDANGEEYTYTQDGSATILLEALAYYESRIDLTKYDTNGDGCIDAVYLIYSASVDYETADFYWAYVTWYGGDTQFTDKNLDAYYYLFAGFDFIDESVAGKDPGSGYPDIAGLKINASTFIHESGHLLGLDDYYDYKTDMGYGYGLGGADMMDYTVGDHGVYSKIMLGWLEPQIVTSTATVTIESLQASGSAILVPLNFNNSYFCEYLLIDLYSAKGLNELHANADGTYLYGGAEYGVRIYHVSSWAENPYNNSFGSFTDYNNSTSYIPLIKLVEADGETNTSENKAWASATDLWQAGQSMSTVFPQYMRNDGKLLNFDITVDSVSANSATVTITFTQA